MWLIRFFVLLFFTTVSFQVEAMSRLPTKNASANSSLGVKTFHFEDGTRKRPVLVEVWYPIEKKGVIESLKEDVYLHPSETRDAALSSALKTYPLIMMSHGHRGDRRDRSWLAERLVKANYIVASVEHYGNSHRTFNPILTLKYWERARDVSYALDQLLVDPLFGAHIDSTKIGFVGYSLGGMTGLAIAGGTVDTMDDVLESNKEVLSEFPPDILANIDFSEAKTPHADRRIKAIFLLAPANFLYKPDSLKQIRIPVGLVSAINDEILPHELHSYPIIQHVVPVKLKVLREEISHFAFLNPVSEVGKKVLPAKYQTDPACCSRASIHKEVGDFAVEFFQETLK